MDTTQNLQLPFILGAQAQKHVTHNEGLTILDALVQLAVEDRDLATPPSSPSEGQRFIIAASPGGDWSGHAGHIATWQDGGWTFYHPKEGWLCFVRDEDMLLAWTGTDWVSPSSAIGAPQNLPMLGVGTTADASNPFSAKLNDALWTAKTAAEGGTGDLRYKLNKESAAKTLSLLMQTNYSGRAEIGLTGDDKLHVKVSGDGSNWKEAVVVDQSTGNVGIGTTNPTQRLEVKAGNIRLSNSDFVAGSAGTFLDASLGVSSGNTYGRIQVFTSGGLAIGDLVLNLYGNVGIGTTTPTCALHVAGPARVGQYVKAALPSAAACGAGAMVYVTDEIGGAVMAFSDGSNWRRMTDRAVVS